MSVRNFYVDADVDGRKTSLSGGPRRKDGGLYLRLTQREEGSIVTALSIKCYVAEDGKLFTVVFDRKGHVVYEYETRR